MAFLTKNSKFINWYSISYFQLLSRYMSTDFHTYPLLHLNQLCDGKLLQTNECIFSPREKDISKALTYFSHNVRQPVVSHKGIVHMSDLPVLNYPEVTFAGRSNCGKSSLMKYIFRNIPNLKLLAVSKKPGHTKVLKFIQVGKYFTLVDQPGYGENMPKHYIETVEQYLKIRKNLRYVFLLIDCQHGISDVDRIGLQMMEEYGNPYAIVLTKIDLLSHHALIRKIVDLQKCLGMEKQSRWFPQPFLISSQSGAGIDLLKTFIAYVTGNIQLDSENT